MTTYDEGTTAQHTTTVPVDDEFQPVGWAECLKTDIASCDLVGLEEANHWMPEDRHAAFRDHCAEFLLGGA